MSIDLLKKKVEEVLETRKISNVKASVKFAIDISGSMRPLFINGTVQKTVDRVMAIAMKFDDNQTLDAFAFQNEAYELSPVKEQSYSNYVQQNILNNRSISLWGGTDYEPVMKLILESEYGATTNSKGFLGLFSKKTSEKTPQHPIYAIILTDGENGDMYETETLITSNKNKNIYWEFVGIGNESFSFCKKMADKYDNVGFIQVKNLEKTSDEVLYNELLNTEFVEWIKKF